MNRLRNICLLLAIGQVALTISAHAQAKAAPTPDPTPNFVGKWKLERTETALATGAFSFSRQEQIEVSQNGWEMKFRFVPMGNKKVYERVYYTDGRGEINPFADDKARETVSTTSIKGGKLIIVGFSRKAGSSEKKKASFSSEWTLSKDNKRLKLIWLSLEENLGQWGQPSETCFYKRQ